MDMKKWYLSKTLWFNVIAFVVLVVNAFGFKEFQPDGELESYAFATVVIINVILRAVTKSALK